MFKNYGDLATSLKDLVEQYQDRREKNKKLSSTKTDVKKDDISIEDLKTFVAEYSNYQILEENVKRHVALVDQLQNQISQRHIFDISVFEQSLSCKDNYAEANKKLEECLNDPKFQPRDLLRLVMLYALHYEKRPNFDTNLEKYIQFLITRGEKDANLVRAILNYGGLKMRIQQLDIFERFKNTFKDQEEGVTNIYTQHKPLLNRIIKNIVLGKLDLEEFPFVEGVPTKDKERTPTPQKLLIFMVGGITYEEACLVHEINNPNNPQSNSLPMVPTILLGGTTILNTSSFIEGLQFFQQE